VIQTEDFVTSIVRAVPELAAVLAEHVADHGVVLPHVFMGDVARFVLARALSPAEQNALRTVLYLMDDGLRNGSDDVKELVVVSFVENLIGEESAVRTLRPLFKPALKAQVDAICGSDE
jgi:hypothetical protein